jgi:hypothetical protein
MYAGNRLLVVEMVPMPGQPDVEIALLDMVEPQLVFAAKLACQAVARLLHRNGG